jgi:hypothetical protein
MSIESAIFQWASDVTGLPCYQAPISTAQDKPNIDYCTFQIVAIVMSDYNQYESQNKDDDFVLKTTSNNAVMTLSINVFSKQGYKKIVDLNASSSFWQYRSQLSDEGLTLNNFGDPQNLTGLGDTDFVDRWQADLEFRVTMQNQYDWDKIKSWAIGGRFIADGGGEIISLVKWPK